MAQDLVTKIREAAIAQQVDPDVAVRIAELESSLNPKAKAKTSSAKGLFQVIDDTWKRYGGTPNKQLDPDENIRVGVTVLADNTTRAKRALGRDPRPSELYAMHFFGPDTAIKVINAPEDRPLSALVAPRVLRANPQLRGKTAGEVLANLNAKFPATMVAAAPVAATATTTPSPVVEEATTPPVTRVSRSVPRPLPAAKPLVQSAELPASYQAALAVSLLAADDEKEKTDENEPTAAEQYFATPSRPSALASLDLSYQSPFPAPVEPVRMAEGGLTTLTPVLDDPAAYAKPYLPETTQRLAELRASDPETFNAILSNMDTSRLQAISTSPLTRLFNPGKAYVEDMGRRALFGESDLSNPKINELRQFIDVSSIPSRETLAIYDANVANAPVGNTVNPFTGEATLYSSSHQPKYSVEDFQSQGNPKLDEQLQVLIQTGQLPQNVTPYAAFQTNIGFTPEGNVDPYASFRRSGGITFTEKPLETEQFPIPPGYAHGGPVRMAEGGAAFSDLKKYDQLRSDNPDIKVDYRPLNFEKLLAAKAVRVTNQGFEDERFNEDPTVGFSLVSGYNDAIGRGSGTAKWPDNPRFYGVVKDLFSTRPQDIGAHKYKQIVESAKDMGLTDEDIYLAPSSDFAHGGPVRMQTGGDPRAAQLLQRFKTPPGYQRAVDRASERETVAPIPGIQYPAEFIGGFVGAAPRPPTNPSETYRIGQALGVGLVPTATLPAKFAGAVPDVLTGLGALGAAGVIKPKGGNWPARHIQMILDPARPSRFRGQDPELRLADVAEELDSLREAGLSEQRVAQYAKNLEPAVEMDKWITNKLGKYIQNEMGTESDPLLKLAKEEGILPPIDPMYLNNVESLYGSVAELNRVGSRLRGFEAKKTQLEPGTPAAAWETLVDYSIRPGDKDTLKHQTLSSIFRPFRHSEFEKMVEKIPENVPIYALDKNIERTLGFGNLSRRLEEMINSDTVVPDALRMAPKDLEKTSVEQAVRKVQAYDNWLQEQERKKAIAVANGVPLYKPYDDGSRWLRADDLANNQNNREFIRMVGCDAGWCTKTDEFIDRYTGPKGGFEGELHVLMSGDGKPLVQILSSYPDKEFKNTYGFQARPLIEQMMFRHDNPEIPVKAKGTKKENEYEVLSRVRDYIRSSDWEVSDKILEQAKLVRTDSRSPENIKFLENVRRFGWNEEEFGPWQRFVDKDVFDKAVARMYGEEFNDGGMVDTFDPVDVPRETYADTRARDLGVNSVKELEDLLQRMGKPPEKQKQEPLPPDVTRSRSAGQLAAYMRAMNPKVETQEMPLDSDLWGYVASSAPDLITINQALPPGQRERTMLHELEHSMSFRGGDILGRPQPNYKTPMLQDNSYRAYYLLGKDWKPIESFIQNMVKNKDKLEKFFGEPVFGAEFKEESLKELLRRQGEYRGLFEEQLSTLSAMEQSTGKFLTQDKEMRKLFPDTRMMAIFDALTGPRQTRMDAKDLPPHTPMDPMAYETGALNRFIAEKISTPKPLLRQLPAANLRVK